MTRRPWSPTPRIRPKKGEAPSKDALAAIRDREVKVRNAANALANDPLFADLQPPYVRRSDSRLGEAVAFLDAGDVEAAVAAEDKALDLLRQELTRLDEQVKESERTIGEAEFRRRAGDQAKNRGSTENLEATSSRLGDVGVALRKDLIHAALDAGGRARPGKGRGRIGGRGAVGRAGRAGEVARGFRPGRRAAAGRAPRGTPDPAQRRAVRDARDPDVDPRDEPVAGPEGRAEIPDGADHRGRPLQEPGGDRRAHRDLLALVEETEYGIALPTTLRILRARCAASRDGSRRPTSPPARSPWRPAWRKTCSS